MLQIRAIRALIWSFDSIQRKNEDKRIANVGNFIVCNQSGVSFLYLFGCMVTNVECGLKIRKEICYFALIWFNSQLIWHSPIDLYGNGGNQAWYCVAYFPENLVKFFDHPKISAYILYCDYKPWAPKKSWMGFAIVYQLHIRTHMHKHQQTRINRKSEGFSRNGHRRRNKTNKKKSVKQKRSEIK